MCLYLPPLPPKVPIFTTRNVQTLYFWRKKFCAHILVLDWLLIYEEFVVWRAHEWGLLLFTLWGKKPIVLPQSRSWCIITTIMVFAYSHYHGLGELSYYGLGVLPLSCSRQNALSWSWRIASITVLANCHYHGLGKMPYRGLGEFPPSRSWQIATIMVLAKCHYHGLGELPLSRSWQNATITVLANCHYHGLGELPLSWSWRIATFMFRAKI